MDGRRYLFGVKTVEVSELLLALRDRMLPAWLRLSTEEAGGRRKKREG